MTISPFVTSWQKRYGVNPDIENERRYYLIIGENVQSFHFKSSARIAKKSNDFFGLISFNYFAGMKVDLEKIKQKRVREFINNNGLFQTTTGLL